jgi:hypothetical protein
VGWHLYEEAAAIFNKTSANGKRAYRPGSHSMETRDSGVINDENANTGTESSDAEANLAHSKWDNDLARSENGAKPDSEEGNSNVTPEASRIRHAPSPTKVCQF